MTPGRLVRATTVESSAPPSDDAQPVLVEARQELAGRRRVDQSAAVEDRDVIADALDVVEDVGRIEHRGLAAQVAHQVEDLAPPDRVERADRFVEQEDGRTADQRLADAEPLAHPARVGLETAVGHVGEADPGQDVVDTLIVRSSRRRIERGHEAHRVAAGHPVVEARLLGEVADLAPVGRPGRDRDAGHGRRAARRPGQAGEQLDRRRLARAVRPEEAVDGAGRDVQA